LEVLERIWPLEARGDEASFSYVKPHLSGGLSDLSDISLRNPEGGVMISNIKLPNPHSTL
jgi:hypothetical protein